MLAMTVFSGALFGFINSVQQIFSDAFHAARSLPIIFAAVAGMTAVSALLNSRIVEKLGMRRVSHVAIIAFTLVEGTHLAIAMAGLETLWVFTFFQAAAMFCFGLTMGNFGALAMEPLAAIAGTAASLQGFINTVGGALIGIVIRFSFNGTVVPVLAGFTLAGVVAMLAILITERGRLFRSPYRTLIFAN